MGLVCRYHNGGDKVELRVPILLSIIVGVIASECYSHFFIFVLVT